MQQKTIIERRKSFTKKVGKQQHVTIAKETRGGMVTMSKCAICGKPAIYTMQSIFVCVPCNYIRH